MWEDVGIDMCRDLHTDVLMDICTVLSRTQILSADASTCPNGGGVVPIGTGATDNAAALDPHCPDNLHISCWWGGSGCEFC